MQENTCGMPRCPSFQHTAVVLTARSTATASLKTATLPTYFFNSKRNDSEYCVELIFCHSY